MIDWPNDYHHLFADRLIERLIDPEDPLKIWDAEFLTLEQIESFECLDDQVVEITPFAVTCGGDYWAYLTENLPSPEIVLCYRDSYDAEYFAKDLSQFIFRQTIAFCGSEGLRQCGGGWSAEDAKRMISLVYSDLRAFVPERMRRKLRQIINEPYVHTAGEWTTLISESMSRQLIEQFVVLDRDELLFRWRG